MFYCTSTVYIVQFVAYLCKDYLWLYRLDRSTWLCVLYMYTKLTQPLINHIAFVFQHLISFLPHTHTHTVSLSPLFNSTSFGSHRHIHKHTLTDYSCVSDIHNLLNWQSEPTLLLHSNKKNNNNYTINKIYENNYDTYLLL